VLTNPGNYDTIRAWKGARPQREKGRYPNMKTAEMIKFNKVYYIMTRYNGRAMNRECFKKKTEATARMKELKREGFTLA